MSNLTVDCWLIVSEAGKYSNHGNANVRLAIKTPTLKPGELPIRYKIEVPRSLFKQPQFVAKIELPETTTGGTDVKIESAVRDLARVVEQNIGIKISFEPTDPEP